MKKLFAWMLVFLLMASIPVRAEHKKSSKEESSSKHHSHKKSSKGKKRKKGKGSKKEKDDGANMESEIKASDVQFNAGDHSK